MNRTARLAISARSRGDDGFTLMELLVTMVIAGILFGLAVGGYRHYAAVQAHRGTAESLVVLMREAQQRAITEGSTYGVNLATDIGPWQLVKGQDCTPGEVRGGEVPTRGGVTVKVTSGDSCVQFKPRGTATAATVEVQRSGKVYKIKVEGLTGRASLS